MKTLQFKLPAWFATYQKPDDTSDPDAWRYEYTGHTGVSYGDLKGHPTYEQQRTNYSVWDDDTEFLQPIHQGILCGASLMLVYLLTTIMLGCVRPLNPYT
jgi:hypothetical protein